MNTYASVIDWLFVQLPMFQSLGAGAYKPGLDTARALDAAFGYPSRRLKCLHVAGTNGKGSTSHALASVLQAAGYKVGLYTSPHLVDFRERIRVNGEKVPEGFVVDFVERYRSMELGLEPSFFELTTIMAFDYFTKAGVDYAVIEVGLGGRLDTTNIIDPIISIITNVSLDHVALLGSTEAEIAKEKAGIMKPGVPVVIGEAQGDVREVFERAAAEAGAPIVFAEDNPVQWREEDGAYVYGLAPGEEPTAKSDLLGQWQPKNINTVLTALNLLAIADRDAIAAGLANVQERTGLTGRWMQIGQCPTMVCDTGHNPGAWQYLAPRLAAIAKERQLRVVIGFANDKDAESIFAQLPRDAEYYFVAPGVKRARAASDLLALGEKHGLKGRAYDSVAAGLDAAMKESAREDFIFTGGSNFVVAEVLSALR